MPVLLLPNGEYANVEDGTPPDVIARIMAENKAKPKAKSAAAPKRKLTGEELDIETRTKAARKVRDSGLGGRGFEKLTKRSQQGYLFNFGDEMSGALDAITRGVPNAIRKGDVGQIGRAYRVGRAVDNNLNNDEVTGGMAAEIAGALANPIGTGAKALSLAPRGSRLANLGARVERAPAITQGIVAGGNQGALNALGSADTSENLLGTAGQGFATGSIFGGAFGAATHGARRMGQIMRDRRPEAAKRTAYSRVSQMLDNAGVSPEKAKLDIHKTDAAGGDAMVMDLTPGLRAQAGAISRRPNVRSSNDLINRGEGRLEARGQLFEDQIRAAIRPSTGQDAGQRMSDIRGAQRASGKASYDDVLDKQFVWNDDLEKFVKDAPPVTRAAMRDAVKLVQNERLDPTSMGFKFDDAGDVVFDRVPSMRVFDYIKRSFDQNIGMAIKAGDRNVARILSKELDDLKAGIARSNPEYANVLAEQRDFFQKTKAVETGLDVIKRLRREPKVVLKELQALDPVLQDDARTGIVEAIIGMRAERADPVKYLRDVMRTPVQRKVLEFAFNGKGNLSRFDRWMRREMRAAKADVLTAPGRQSETARFDQADESLKANVGGLAQDALRGFAFGGPAGATAAAARKFQDLRSGTGAAAMDEIAKILMSKGVDLPKGVSAAEKFQTRRKASNAKAAVGAAKAGQQLFTGYGG